MTDESVRVSEGVTGGGGKGGNGTNIPRHAEYFIFQLKIEKPILIVNLTCLGF